MNKMISASEKMSKEYCCTFVKIGEVQPIEGSDFLGVTVVEGRDIVVRKDQVKEGDKMFYVANECQLNSDFLSVNNMFEDWTLNANASQITEATKGMSEDETKEYIRKNKGYFNKYGRVRMVKLRGVMSMGFLFGEKEMQAWCPDFDASRIETGTDFDTVNGMLFAQAYVPPVRERVSKSSRGKWSFKRVTFDRIIPGQFAFHYDTDQLNREIYNVRPDDIVTISVKLHGTSFIAGRVKTIAPRWGGLYSKVFVHLPKCLQFTKEAYDSIYSSRTRVKNQYINGLVPADVWRDYGEIVKPYLTDGLTIYGEICGFSTGSNSAIQKGYDYKCSPGKNFLMVYRVSELTPVGRKEYEVSEVYEWTKQLVDKMRAENDENWQKIHPIDILYHGTLHDMYPSIAVDDDWHKNVLEALKKEKKFGMEEFEPLCANKVPREGIVLRIDGDLTNEAFKLKCLKFLSKEAKDIDSGDYSDIEANERYV